MRLLIVRNNSNEDAVKASDELADYLNEHKIDNFVCGSLELPRLPQMPLIPEQRATNLRFHGKPINMVVVFGGDGTVLRAARMTGTSGVPILGINYGHLGFLSNPRTDGAIAMVQAALEGKVHREERANLHIDITYYHDEHKDLTGAGSMLTESYFALNELAITRGDNASMLRVAARIDHRSSLNYMGDGLIISTPTGSTAYNLSVGGPVLDPELAGWVLSPIAAHSLSMRPLVVKDSSTIEISVETRADSFRVSADGKPVSLNVSDRLIISKAPYTVKLIQQTQHAFADTLREKLGMGTTLV